MPTAVPAPVYHLFVGIDIAAASATCAWMQPGASISRPLTIEQTPAGMAQLQTRLRATGIAPADTLIVTARACPRAGRDRGSAHAHGTVDRHTDRPAGRG